MKNNVCLLLCTTGLFLHQVRSVPWNKLQWANYWFSSRHSDVNCLFKEMMNLVCTDECELQYVHKYGSNMDQIWNALKDISFCIATAETVINAVLQLSSLADALEIKPSTIPAHLWFWIYCYSLLLLFVFWCIWIHLRILFYSQCLHYVPPLMLILFTIVQFLIQI